MDNILRTVSAQTALGFAGVGVVIFLLLFILLMRSERVDESARSLYSLYMKWGVGFSVFCGLATLLTTWLDNQRHSELTVAFSPNFATRKLPEPTILLADGSKPAIAKPFVHKGGMIQIDADDTLNAVSALKATAETMIANAERARLDRDKAVEALAAAVPQTPTVAGEVRALERSSAEAAQMEKQATIAIRNGDFLSALTAGKAIQRHDAMTRTAMEAIVKQ